MNNNLQKAITEGLLFIHGDEGIALEDIAIVLEISMDNCEKIIKELNEEYQNTIERAFVINKFANKYWLTTKKEHYDYYLKLISNNKGDWKLSQAALEVLAIIAYRAPISRPEIEDLRGVSSEGIIYKLKGLELIEECGKSDLPGKPLQYQTTEKFLKIFNINKLSDLPVLKEIIENEEESFF